MTPTEVVARFVAEVLEGARPDSTDELVSSEELRERARRLRLAFPDLGVETVVLLADGDLVAGHFVGRGTHEGIFNGVPPTGAAWEARFTAVYRVVNQRIDDAWVTWDNLALMEQLGAVERVSSVSA